MIRLLFENFIWDEIWWESFMNRQVPVYCSLYCIQTWCTNLIPKGVALPNQPSTEHSWLRSGYDKKGFFRLSRSLLWCCLCLKISLKSVIKNLIPHDIWNGVVMMTVMMILETKYYIYASYIYEIVVPIYAVIWVICINTRKKIFLFIVIFIPLLLLQKVIMFTLGTTRQTYTNNKKWIA